MKRLVPGRWKPYPEADSLGGIVLFHRRTLSPELRNFRDIVVALPPSYFEDRDRRYPVIYMQDGQNLFDPSTAYAGAWQLGPTLADAAVRGTEAIVIGVANAKKQRLYEYSPYPDVRLGGGGGDRYLAFLTGTLKPSVDRDFRTLPDRAHTSVAGSSMGGLISLYAVYRRGDVFGSAACLSPSIWFGGRRVLGFVASAVPYVNPRIYLDIGLHEPVGAVSDVRSLRQLLVEEGYSEGEHLEYIEDAQGGHNEETWGRRAARALDFLVEPSKQAAKDP